MPKRSKRDIPKIRQLPKREEVEEALHWFCEREQKPVITTIIMKARKPSRQTKVPRLLNTHIYVTNLKYRILERYREHLDEQRTDGAIALVLRAQHLGMGRSQALGQMISSDYLKPLLTDEDRQYHSRIHQGVCKEVAGMLINWVQDITGSILSAATLKTDADREVDTKADTNPAEQHADGEQSHAKQQRRRSTRKRLSRKKRDAPMTLEEVYAAWKQKRQVWERAAATPIPFGRYEGTPLGEIGRREARWLMERLLPVDEIEATLEFVEQLIADPTAISEEAGLQEHLYMRDGGREFKHRRAVRAHRLMQRLLDPPGDLILLGMLHKDELLDVRNELQTMRNAGEEFESLLPPFHEALQEAQQLATFSDCKDTEFKNFRHVFEIFLYEKPSDYPEIHAVMLTDEHTAELHATYESRLRWFSPNRKRKNDVEKYIDQDREHEARTRLLTAAGSLTPPTLQPIPFIGTMRPAHYNVKKKNIQATKYRDFALLFDEDTHEYVAAICTRGRKDPVTLDEIQERQEKQQQQKRAGRLRFANFPETRFEPSETNPCMLLPLEWGEYSGRRRFREQRQPMLKQLIEEQRAKQQALHADNTANDSSIPLEMCLPAEVPFRSAKVVLQWDEKGNPEFFFHITTTLPATKPAAVPKTVIGFHEHEEGYSFAELALDGSIVSGGDLRIPPHVDPACGAKRSDNYLYEVVHAMLRLSRSAYIGVEDTIWRKDQPDLSRARNRQVFGRPSGRILDTLQWKGRQSGVLEPHIVQEVAPTRDCSQCGRQQPEDSKCLEWWQFVMCPNEQCQTWQVWQADAAVQVCPACRHTWRVESATIIAEHYFVCPTCQNPALPARQNTAIVVAQETLCQLIPHYKNAKKFDEERKKRQAEQARRKKAEQAGTQEGVLEADTEDTETQE